MSPWETLSSEELLTVPVRIVRERLCTQQGREITYIYRLGSAKAVFVLPRDHFGSGAAGPPVSVPHRGVFTRVARRKSETG